MTPTTEQVSLYLHTHWDREWYLPYESYRTRLVQVVRDVVERLESGDLPNFLLDGQSCVLEDIVEIDPSLGPRIKALMAKNLLSAGPWYVLADQFLVCGESLMRNLQIGLEVTRQFGEPAMIGYCPDTFGHTGDMPLILRAFGIESAFVWRGVPPLDGLPAFWWSSQDNSSVLAHHLIKGYYHTAFHGQKTTAELLDHLKQFIRGTEYGSKEKNGSLPPFLVPVGADHHAPPQELEKTLRQLNAEGAAFGVGAITVNGLSDFSKRWQQAAADNLTNLPTVKGELRDNTAALRYERAFLLQGVLSTRIYLKIKNRGAEHRLLRICEPLYTILHLKRGINYPEAELRYAWKLLLKNHPHDSICGCSIDQVHNEMLYRWNKLNQQLDALDARAAELSLSRHTDSGQARVCINAPIMVSPEYEADSVEVFNLSSETVSCPVLVSWAEDPSGKEKPARLKSEELQLISKERQSSIFSSTGGEPDVRSVDVHRAWAWAQDVLPFSSSKIELNKNTASNDSADMVPIVTVAKGRIDNGLLCVEVEANGDLIVTAHSGKGRSQVYRLGHHIVDIGDAGDTYNFDPLLDDEPIVATPVMPVSGAWQRGPLVGSIAVTYKIDIPAGLNDEGDGDEPELTNFSRTERTVPHTITTEISLRRGVPIVFFDTRWVNKSADHRLEVVFDTGQMVNQTFSESHFSVTQRSHKPMLTKLPVAKGCEAPPDSFPCQRFFIANRQLFLNRGLPEYRAGGTDVSMTIVRAVSQLSRPRLLTRGAGAGPAVQTPEANCTGLNEVAYAWAPLVEATDAEQLAQAYKLAELFEGPLWTMPCSSKVVTSGPLLTSSNNCIRVGALFMQSGKARVRLLNVSGLKQSTKLSINLPNAALAHTDAEGRILDTLKAAVSQRDGASVFTLELSPHQLRTYSLAAGSGAD